MGRPEDEAFEAWRMLVRTLHRARRVMHPVFREHDLNGARYAVLRHLMEAGDEGLRLGEIGARLLVTQGNVTGLVDHLEELGYVMRHADPEDRRSTIARVTPTGVKAMDEIQPVVADKAAQLLSCLSPPELADLRSMLERISDRTSELIEKDCNQAGDATY